MCIPDRSMAKQTSITAGLNTNLTRGIPKQQDDNCAAVTRNCDANNINKRAPQRLSNLDKISKAQPEVQHNYHDHAKEPSLACVDTEKLKLRCCAAIPFPIKLLSLLEQVEQDGLGDIISWQPHGRSFVIHKPKEFIKILPQYFKLSKIASFQRQLNLYGFQRLTQGLDKGGYYNEYFLRGVPHIAWQMTRTKVKGTGVRRKSNPDQEPDFWSMSWVAGAQHQASRSSGPLVSQDTLNRVSQPSATPHTDPVPVKQALTDGNVPPTPVPSESDVPLNPGDSKQDNKTASSPAHRINEWGQSFYSLDMQLEELISPCPLQQNEVGSPASRSCCKDMDDDVYMDEVLGSIIAMKGQESDSVDLQITS